MILFIELYIIDYSRKKSALGHAFLCRLICASFTGHKIPIFQKGSYSRRLRIAAGFLGRVGHFSLLSRADTEDAKRRWEHGRQRR